MIASSSKAPPAWPSWETSAETPTATTAGIIASAKRPNGTIFARPDRPIPQQARKASRTRVPTAWRRPRRGPS